MFGIGVLCFIYTAFQELTTFTSSSDWLQLQRRFLFDVIDYDTGSGIILVYISGSSENLYVFLLELSFRETWFLLYINKSPKF